MSCSWPLLVVLEFCTSILLAASLMLERVFSARYSPKQLWIFLMLWNTVGVVLLVVLPLKTASFWYVAFPVVAIFFGVSLAWYYALQWVRI